MAVCTPPGPSQHPSEQHKPPVQVTDRESLHDFAATS
jgi:hypothetical protein